MNRCITGRTPAARPHRRSFDFPAVEMARRDLSTEVSHQPYPVEALPGPVEHIGIRRGAHQDPWSAIVVIVSVGLRHLVQDTAQKLVGIDQPLAFGDVVDRRLARRGDEESSVDLGQKGEEIVG